MKSKIMLPEVKKRTEGRSTAKEISANSFKGSAANKKRKEPKSELNLAKDDYILPENNKKEAGLQSVEENALDLDEYEFGDYQSKKKDRINEKTIVRNLLGLIN